jgi:hypothetical protein
MAALSVGELPSPRAAFCRAFLAFAQRAFCAAAILARASGLTVRFFALFFALFAAELAVVAFLPADTAEVLRAALLTVFCDFAQRALCAAAILSRASALNVRFFPELPAMPSRPDFRFPAVLVPVSNALTCCSRDISASISATIVWLSMNPPVLRITYNLTSTNAQRVLLIGVGGAPGDSRRTYDVVLQDVLLRRLRTSTRF